MQACQGPCEAAEGTFQEEPSLIPQVWQSMIHTYACAQTWMDHAFAYV